MNDPRPAALVVGTTFGRHYARALAAAGSPVRLAGLMGTGGRGGRQLAQSLSVPYITEIDCLKIDFAVVVVRSAVVGGDGDSIARDLLAHGVPVLQELPVHSRDLAATVRVARQSGVRYGVNSFYEHLLPSRRLHAAVHELAKTYPLRGVDIRTSVQVLHGALHLLATIIGGSPATVDTVVRLSGSERYCVSTMWREIPITLLVNNYLDPSDPNNNCQPLIDVAVSFDVGEFRLPSPHGPLLWNRRLHECAGEFHLPGEMLTSMSEPESMTGYAVEELWHGALRHAVMRFASGALDLAQSHIAVGRFWETVSARIGRPSNHQVPQPAPAGLDVFAPAEKVDAL